MSVKGFICQQQAKNNNHNPANLLHSIPAAVHNENLNYTIDDGLENRYNCSTAQLQRRSNNYTNNQQIGPINLVTTDINSYTGNSRPSQSMCTSSDEVRPSSSSSVDVENDGSMSPACVSSNSDKLNTATTSCLYKLPPYDLTASNQENVTSVAAAAAAAAAAYQLNFTNLYANGAVFYGNPTIFSPHHQSMTSTHPSVMRPSHISYMDALSSTQPNAPPCDSSLFSAAYLQTMQNTAAAVGLYDPNAHTHQQQQQQQQQAAHVTMTETPLLAVTCKTNQSAKRNPPQSGSLSALAPSGPVIVPNEPPRITTSVHRRKCQKRKTLDAPICPANTKLANTTTYLNDKVNAAVSDATNFFKVPNGKEGSLKHRILTRPLNLEKTESTKMSSMRTHNSTSNFKKGSYIALSNGVLRRVEDMRTEDFIQCADRSLYLQLAESTIVKIYAKQPQIVVITFSYDKNNSKADIDVSADHPFFVYGQGWASCNPEMSLKVFGLKCQRLQVGDICISLTKRELSKANYNTVTADTKLNSKSVSHQEKSNIDHNSQYKLPEIQSTYLKHVPTNVLPTTPIVSVTPLAATQYNTSMHLTPTNVSSHNQYDIAEMVAEYTSGAQTTRDHSHIPGNGFVTNPSLHHLPPKLLESFYRQSQPLMHTSNQQSILARPPSIRNVLPQYDSSISTTKENHNSTFKGSTDMFFKNDSTGQNEPVDASISRKRRWSAPESFNDDTEECQPQRKSIDITENSIYLNYFTSTTPSEGSNGSTSSS